MARTKTTSKLSEEHSQPPPSNTAADQSSDQPLNETPLRTVLKDKIIPATKTQKSSKPGSSKFIRPRTNPTRRSTRMKKPLKKPKVSHVNLVSDEEKKDSGVDEDSEEVTEEDPEEDEEEDSEQTLSEMIKSVRASSKKGKNVATPSPSKESSSSQEESDENGESEESSPNEEKKVSSKKSGNGKEMAKAAEKIYQRRKKIESEAFSMSEEEDEPEVEKGSSKKHGKGKDIAALKTSRAEKIALRPMSRTKYFNLESLETKAWNMKEFTEPQGWTNFITLQEHTYEDLVREFYTNLSVQEKKNGNEKFLISSVKGVKIKMTQEFVSEAFKIPNEAIKQTSAGLPYGMHLTSIFQKAKVPLEGEKRKLDFMTFSSKTLGQLHITSSNMPVSKTSGPSGSGKRISDQNVQIAVKKRRVEEITDTKTPSPPAENLFYEVSKLAKEIVKQGSSQFKALIGESMTKEDAQKIDDASPQEEAEKVNQAEESEEIPQDAVPNSVDQDQRVEEKY
ncbi:nucleolin-like [Medicago truncatula]|uniref:nucleolin-like n=1 Tax=Medicago truncatula TaxID=3880 RepID=UPI000D2F2B30|nr:nucleolin-like [Medicago truncatula]